MNIVSRSRSLLGYVMVSALILMAGIV
ncbi:MAG: hypothetical protein RIR49_38, partial [Actinomycetota bacterium]